MTSAAISAARRSCRHFVAAVSQAWVAACRDSAKRVSEEEFLVSASEEREREGENERGRSKIFGGCVFTSLGFSEDPRGERDNASWVRACGGDYVSSGDYVRTRHGDVTGNGKRVTHVIVAHGSGSAVAAAAAAAFKEREREEGCVLVSQQWVEASRTVGELLDPAECPVLRPLPRRLPYESMKGVTICFTGLSLRKLFLYTLLARDIGATVILC